MNEVKHSAFQDQLALERQFEQFKDKSLDEILQLLLSAKVEKVNAQRTELAATLSKRQKEIAATMETLTTAAESIDFLSALQPEIDNLQKNLSESKLTQINLKGSLTGLVEQLPVQKKNKKELQQEADQQIDTLKRAK